MTTHKQRQGFQRPRASLRFRLATIISPSMLLMGCASASLDHAGSLSSYEGLKNSSGTLTQTQIRVDKDRIIAAKTVSLVPTVFAAGPGTSDFSDEQRALVANAVDRSLCLALEERLKVVAPGERADLMIHATVSNAGSTNAAFAGVSKVVGLVPMILLPGVPVPVPRIPIGLGSLSVEAEAMADPHTQVAAMIWARGADFITSKARVSSNGDAYDLASSFGSDFGKLIVTGSDPIRAAPSLPTQASILRQVGIEQDGSACTVYGSSTGLKGFIAGSLGLPPSVADNGAASTR